MAAVAPTTDSDDEETRHNRMHTNTTSAIDEAMGAIGRELLRDAEEEEAPSHSEEAPSHSEEDSEGAPCGEGLRATASELEEGSEV